jgi:hypothetical protein
MLIARLKAAPYPGRITQRVQFLEPALEAFTKAPAQVVNPPGRRSLLKFEFIEHGSPSFLLSCHDLLIRHIDLDLHVQPAHPSQRFTGS